MKGNWAWSSRDSRKGEFTDLFSPHATLDPRSRAEFLRVRFPDVTLTIESENHSTDALMAGPPFLPPVPLRFDWGRKPLVETLPAEPGLRLRLRLEETGRAAGNLTFDPSELVLLSDDGTRSRPPDKVIVRPRRSREDQSFGSTVEIHQRLVFEPDTDHVVFHFALSEEELEAGPAFRIGGLRIDGTGLGALTLCEMPGHEKASRMLASPASVWPCGLRCMMSW